MIERQTEFIAIVLKEIVSRYEDRSSNLSVIVIGHSMGGVVAHYLFTKPYFDYTKVKAVITLASPLIYPVFGNGPQMDNVYADIHKFWEMMLPGSPTSQLYENLTFISFTGGTRDLQVFDASGDITHHLPSSQFLHISTSAVAGVWASCDHLCIVWYACLQSCIFGNT